MTRKPLTKNSLIEWWTQFKTGKYSYKEAVIDELATASQWALTKYRYKCFNPAASSRLSPRCLYISHKANSAAPSAAEAAPHHRYKFSTKPLQCLDDTLVLRYRRSSYIRLDDPFQGGLPCADFWATILFKPWIISATSLFYHQRRPPTLQTPYTCWKITILCFHSSPFTHFLQGRSSVFRHHSRKRRSAHLNSHSSGNFHGSLPVDADRLDILPANVDDSADIRIQIICPWHGR